MEQPPTQSPGSLERMVRPRCHLCGNENEGSREHADGINATREVGNVSPQSLLTLLSGATCQGDEMSFLGRTTEERHHAQCLYRLWQELGRPVKGFWRELIVLRHYGTHCVEDCWSWHELWPNQKLSDARQDNSRLESERNPRVRSSDVLQDGK